MASILRFASNGMVLLRAIKIQQALLALFLLCVSAGHIAAQEQVVLFPGVTGNALIDSLRAHFKPSSVRGYNEARDSMFMSFNYLDGAVECFYTGDTVRVQKANARVLAQNRGYNTEHIWPQSKFLGRGNAYSDLHHLRPTRADVNQSRNNYRFRPLAVSDVSIFWRGRVNQSAIPASDLGSWSKTQQGTTFDSSFFEPRDIVKGDVARAMFYFYTMYEAEALATDSDFFVTQMTNLLAFHNGDPSDLIEHQRTLKIATIQSGKANPFILDSTLVRRAYFTNYSGPTPPPVEDGRFVAEYTFSGTASCTDEDVEPTRQSAGITLSSFYRLGVNCNLVSNAFNSNGWTLDFSNGHYIGFAAEAASGSTVGFTSSDTLKTFIRRSGTGPGQYRFILVADGQAQVLREGSVGANSTIELKISMPELRDIKKLELRVHAWGATSPNGTFRITSLSLSGDVIDSDIGTGLFDQPSELPEGIELHPAYPNPFNPNAVVPFSVGKTDNINLLLYDILGRQVRVLTSGTYLPGAYQIPVSGIGLPSGVYIIRLVGSGTDISSKITLLK